MARDSTYDQDRAFRLSLSENVDFDTDANWLIDFIEANFAPDEIFPIDILEQWAEENGYTKEE